ncbi:MAG: Argininosuccinate lyase [Alphaproteobacteria bacterium MarineAlpha5_Bin5]|nr:MAG: Argininosuccinate lyase [Alphaproteobacteria bacterium MarineAlpha5_Bin5]PPR52823.1 MAG: Argininosuccinate lyase [Alphaproteobacteria bacterium MarineAlpha5_Bin4]|tara:strand:+ start:2044 stop:3426 length:1383 start_codon:yes stop_codon:yes gene_type:complete
MKKNPARNVHLKKGPSKLLEKINSSIEIDQRLYREDIEVSIAHAKMLATKKIISKKEKDLIVKGLNKILKKIQADKVSFKKELEDIHMNIESLLFKEIGKTAGKLHTARSRNDQIVTDFKLWIKNNSKELDENIKLLQKTLINISKKNLTTIMPGYTHLQIAQPISLAHHCIAYVEMLGRDRSRLSDCLKRLNENPLGSGALAGTSFPIDRNLTTKLLSFKKPTVNALDSVSDRDFAVEFVFVLSLINIHLSRMAEEIIIWSNQQFNFIKLPDDVATGSSIMPQKRNPDGAELVRGNSSVVIGNLNSLLVILKGLPLGYSKDMQNDKKIVFNSYDEIILSLKVMNELWSKIKFNKINMKNAVDQSNSTATDLANWFVKELNLTFREAYQLTGKIVAYSNNNGKLLKDLSLNELKVFNKNISASAKKILSSAESIKNKTSFGGTSPQNTKKTIQYAIRKYL